MGCDIHLFAQRRIKQPWYKAWLGHKDRWVSVDKYSPNEDYGKWDGEPEFTIKSEDRIYTDGRNYNLFCALCGVRSYHFNDNPPMISEPKGLPPNLCPEIQREVDNYGSDGHSHSWNFLKELESFDWSSYGKTCDDFRNEVIPKLRAITNNPEDIMIVYFFDN